jgi:hypothetical protein
MTDGREMTQKNGHHFNVNARSLFKREFRNERNNVVLLATMTFMLFLA